MLFFCCSSVENKGMQFQLQNIISGTYILHSASILAKSHKRQRRSLAGPRQNTFYQYMTEIREFWASQQMENLHSSVLSSWPCCLQFCMISVPFLLTFSIQHVTIRITSICAVFSLFIFFLYPQRGFKKTGCLHLPV